MKRYKTRDYTRFCSMHNVSMCQRSRYAFNPIYMYEHFHVIISRSSANVQFLRVQCKTVQAFMAIMSRKLGLAFACIFQLIPKHTNTLTLVLLLHMLLADRVKSTQQPPRYVLISFPTRAAIFLLCQVSSVLGLGQQKWDCYAENKQFIPFSREKHTCSSSLAK